MTAGWPGRRPAAIRAVTILSVLRGVCVYAPGAAEAAMAKGTLVKRRSPASHSAYHRRALCHACSFALGDGSGTTTGDEVDTGVSDGGGMVDGDRIGTGVDDGTNTDISDGGGITVGDGSDTAADAEIGTGVGDGHGTVVGDGTGTGEDAGVGAPKRVWRLAD